jgi:Tfp pilus assembly protein PilO
MMEEENKIISLTEVIESKVIKEKELEFYREQLVEIQRKIGFLELDLNLTKQIIGLIEKESIVSIDNSVPLLGVEPDADV